MNHTSLTTTHQVLAVAFSLACPLVFAGTDGYITTSTAAGYSDVGPAAMYAGQSGEQSGINMRESARIPGWQVLRRFGKVSPGVGSGPACSGDA